MINVQIIFIVGRLMAKYDHFARQWVVGFYCGFLLWVSILQDGVVMIRLQQERIIQDIFTRPAMRRMEVIP